MSPGALPWAGMSDAFGVVGGRPLKARQDSRGIRAWVSLSSVRECRRFRERGISLELETDVAEAASDFGKDALFLGGTFGVEGDAETQIGAGVIPGDGGNQFFGNEPLG